MTIIDFFSFSCADVFQIPRKLVTLSGRYQSMKPMIGKSIDQSMTIDAN